MSEARQKLYKRREVRDLLAWVLSGHEVIKPAWSNERHEYTYPEVEAILGLRDPRPILEELSDAGIFQRSLVTVTVACPICHSSRNIENRYYCPFCDSLNIRRATLVEHYACGAVDFLEKFHRPDGRLVCPKCGKELKLVGTDYRRIEGVYRCLNCKRDFSVPNLSHYCVTCKEAFSYQKGELHEVYEYRLGEKLKGEVMASVGLELEIANLLKSRGFDVEAKPVVVGASGVGHKVDMMAYKDGEKYLIEVASGEVAVTPDALMGFFLKNYDIEPEHTILIAVPKLSEEAKKLRKLEAVAVVEGKDPEEIVERLGKALEGMETDKVPSGRKPKTEGPRPTSLMPWKDYTATLRERAKRMRELLGLEKEAS